LPAPPHSPPASSCPVIAIFGRRGTGKTTKLRELMRRAPRLFVFDHMAEFQTEPGAEVHYELAAAILRLKRSSSGGLARVVFTPASQVTPELFDLACRVPFAIHGLTFVVDEIDSLAGSVNPPAPESFRRLIHFGRHIGCATIVASRRPADVPRLLSSQATRVICFAQTEPADLKWLRSVVGPRADELPRLADLHYLDFDMGTRQVIEGTVTPGC
jgi:hypothetical protein